MVKLQIPAGSYYRLLRSSGARPTRSQYRRIFVSKFNRGYQRKGGGYSRGNKRLRRPNIFVQAENPAGFGLIGERPPAWEKGSGKLRRAKRKITRAKLKETPKMEDQRQRCGRRYENNRRHGQKHDNDRVKKAPTLIERFLCKNCL